MSRRDVAVRVGRRVAAVEVERAIVPVLVIVAADVEDHAAAVIVAVIRHGHQTIHPKAKHRAFPRSRSRYKAAALPGRRPFRVFCYLLSLSSMPELGVGCLPPGEASPRPPQEGSFWSRAARLPLELVAVLSPTRKNGPQFRFW